MVSDQEIASCVESLLRQSDPGGGGGVVSSVNVNGVVQQLEAKLGQSLSHKAGFIRDQINLLLRPPAPAAREHFAFQQQPQHHLQQQQQFFHPHQLLQHPQIPASPFTHLPPQHDLAFRCAPAVPMQPQHVLHHHQQQQQTQPALMQQQLPLPPAAGVAATGKQEGKPVPRSSAPGKGRASCYVHYMDENSYLIEET